MKLKDLNQAIHECNGGYLNFNTGTIRAFLFERNWYPLRAVVNRAAEIANDNIEHTTDRALVELAYLGLWVRVKDVFFGDKLPVEISDNEMLLEVKELTIVLFKITPNT